jgi:hypothetical protein
MAAPVGDVGALAVKMELFFSQVMEPHSVDENVVAALRGDLGRLGTVTR